MVNVVLRTGIACHPTSSETLPSPYLTFTQLQPSVRLQMMEDGVGICGFRLVQVQVLPGQTVGSGRRDTIWRASRIIISQILWYVLTHTVVWVRAGFSLSIGCITYGPMADGGMRPKRASERRRAPLENACRHHGGIGVWTQHK